jgi:methionyl-tRNA formyltransferase
MRYIFFGSSEFAKIVLEKLLQNNLKPVLVITQPPKPKGRKQILSPTLVQFIAEQNNIPFLTPENLNDKDFLQTIKNLQPDLILLTAYAKIIPSVLLKLPPQGFLNLHPSFLPRYRGATPIQSTILAGDKETGVTLFLMDEQIDHGPIIANSKLLITNYQITYSELSKKLANLGAKLIIETLPQLLQDKITPLPQDESLATYCHKITKEDEKINWQNSAEEIDRKVRALNPNPGVFTIAQEKIIKIIKGFPSIDDELSVAKQIGEVFECEKKMAIKCGKEFYVVEVLKPAGKDTMTSESFLNGNRWIIGITL